MWASRIWHRCLDFRLSVRDSAFKCVEQGVIWDVSPRVARAGVDLGGRSGMGLGSSRAEVERRARVEGGEDLEVLL